MKWFFRSAVVGVAWSMVAIILLEAGVRPFPAPLMIIAGFILVAPAFAVGILQANRAGVRASRGFSRSRDSLATLTELRRYLPVPALVVAGIAFFGLWVVMLISILSLGGGNPGRSGGTYTLDNHGTVTVIDQAAYVRASTAQDRLGLAGSGLFGVAASLLCAPLERRDHSHRIHQDSD